MMMSFKGSLLLSCSFSLLLLLCRHLTAQEVCQSPTCQQLADDLLHQSMNRSADPCEDFYEYICGNYNYELLQPPLNESSPPTDTDNNDNAISNKSPPNIVLTGTMYTRQELLNEELKEAFTAAVNSSSSKTSSSKTIRVVTEFYRECTDGAASRERLGTEPLLSYIEQLVGGWPMLRRNSSSSSNTSNNITSWKDIFVNVYSLAGLNYVFDIRTEIKAVKIRAGWSLMDKLVEPTSRQRYDAYDLPFHRQLKRFIFELTEQLSPAGADRVVDLRLLSEIEQLAHFEWKLVNAYRNSSSDFLSQLLEVTSSSSSTIEEGSNSPQPREEWIELLNRMQDNFGGETYTSRPFRRSTRILSLPKPAYLERVVAILNSTPLEVVQNFFATAVALEYGALTTGRLRAVLNRHLTRKRAFTFTAGGGGSNSEECISALGQWPAAVDRLYVERHFSSAEKAAATVLVEEVRATLKANLRGNQWLDESTKRKAMQRLEDISPVVGYEDFILDNGQLDEFYREQLEGIGEVADLSRSNRPGAGIFNGKYFRLCSHYLLLKGKLEQVDLLTLLFELKSKNSAKRKKMTYDISSATVNAYYSKLQNSIIIPAGILKPPFFDRRAPTALNYGSIATIIGHELTHCIDSMGVRSSSPSKSSRSKSKNWAFTFQSASEDEEETTSYNKDHWWTEEAAESFQEKAQCMVEQYDEVVDEAIGLHLDGTRTLMENLSDNSGLRSAYGAFAEHQKRAGRSRLLPGLNFTAEQLFFVSHAKTWCEATSKQVSFISWIIDNHSPNKYRVNVALGNFERFAEAFHCPAGSPMNPTDKCTVW